jgi:hypothetical protein
MQYRERLFARSTIMKRLSFTAARLVVAACIILAAGVASAAKPPETWDGLVYKKTKGIDAVYVRPDVEFKAYRNVVIDPVEVAFDKNWKPNRDVTASRRLSTDDMQKIRDDMASEFRRIFAEQLAAGGYDVVAKPLEDTLRVSAALADVYITAPDTMTAGRTRTYTQSAGRMTLAMELRDGPTGQLLARVVDRHVDDSAWVQRATSVSNSAEFRRAVTDWAKRLVSALDRVTDKTP